MSDMTLSTAGIILVVLPTVAFGGLSILRMVFISKSGYMDNPLRQRLWAAGHAHAGVLLALSLAALAFLDAAALPRGLKVLVSWAIPASAIFVPAAFFFSVAAPDAERPNALIYLAYVGFASLVLGTLVLGIGLLRAL